MNFDSSVHSTRLQPATVLCLWALASFSRFFKFLADMKGFFTAMQPFSPALCSILRTVRPDTRESVRSALSALSLGLVLNLSAIKSIFKRPWSYAALVTLGPARLLLVFNMSIGTMFGDTNWLSMALVLKWYLPFVRITPFPGHSGASSSQVILQLVDHPFFKRLVVRRHQNRALGSST